MNICAYYAHFQEEFEHLRNETTYQAVLGRLIAQKRKEKQIDQEEMARRVGVSRSTWSRIEAGSSALNVDQLAKAASALDLPLGQLMMEADEIVRELRRQNVEVHDSRDQAESVLAKAVGLGSGVGPVAFLGGAVLGGIIAAVLAARSTEDKRNQGENGS
ncbi:MAG: helix-turn-helix transcriptional regulator [Rhodospirillaceae bacterium]|nr:helix-turn-helix transcriptional regulator [Rhodospirillaceae bacterium]